MGQAGHLVAATLRTREGHGCERGDGQDNLIPMGVTHALTAEGADASEDGTGRGTPLVSWAFSHTQGMDCQPSTDVFPTLRAGGGGQSVAYPLAVRGREGGAQLEIGPEDGPYNALRAGNGGSSRTPMIATAYQCHGSNVGEMGALRQGNGAVTGGVPFTFHENQRGELTTSDTAGSLKTGGGKPGQGYPAALVDAAVRRLTPLECERLMGWPDGHTLIDKTSDSARYKQCGNGIAAPVAEWIGWRLKAYAEGWRP